MCTLSKKVINNSERKRNFCSEYDDVMPLNGGLKNNKEYIITFSTQFIGLSLGDRLRVSLHPPLNMEIFLRLIFGLMVTLITFKIVENKK